jgi:hypothetical protein
MLEQIKYFPIEHELVLKSICWTLMVLCWLITLYSLAILFVVVVYWVTGIPPVHYIPGMTTYDHWRR